MKRSTRTSILSLAGMLLFALVSTSAPAGAAVEGPRPGIRYSTDESGVELDVYEVPPSRRREILVFLRMQCDGFTPQARVVVPVRRGVFRVEGTFSDPDTTDIVDADIELVGRFGADKTARVDVSVDLEAYDNGGETGSCDREVSGIELTGEPDDALAAMGPALALSGDRTPALAVGGDLLFVADQSARRTTLLAVDPSGAITSRTQVKEHADALAAVDDTVWALDADAGTVVRIDLDDGDTIESVEVGAPVEDTPPGDPGRVVSALAVSDGSLWTATATQILRVDPASAVVTARIATNGTRVLDLAGSDDGLYAVIEDRGEQGLTGRILRIDPATNEISAEVALETPFVGPLVTGADALWTARPVERRDLVSLAVLAPATADGVLALGLVDAPPGVWVDGTDGLVVLDTELDVVFELPGIRGNALVSSDATVWIADARIGRLFRFET